MKFKSGDMVTIVDIHKGDGYYPYKDQLIGKKMILVSNPIIHKPQGYYFVHLAKLKRRITISSGQSFKMLCFYKVKMRKETPL